MLRRPRALILALALMTVPSCFVENVAGRFCKSDGDCTEAGYPVCKIVDHTCITAAMADLGTSDGGDMMPPTMCTTSASCPATAPICSSQQLCTGCGAAGLSAECATYHAPTTLCGPSGGCVECLGKDNCESKHQTCNSSYACAACAANADCTSGLCNAATGLCVDRSMLLYVNSSPGCSDAGAGSLSMPFCSVQHGLTAAAAAAKPLIVFPGVGYAEALQANATLNGGNDYVVSAVGVGNPVLKPASAGPALAVLGSPAGKQVTVSMDGFVLDSSTLADGSDGVDCNGSGAGWGKTIVSFVRSTVKGSSGIGLSAQAKCTINLDADVFTGHKLGGIAVNTTDFAMTNLVVSNNGTLGASGSAFGGINLSAAGEAGRMSMFNLTVVNNRAKTSPTVVSGITCSAAPTALTNSVVFGNQGPTLEIVATDCQPGYSAFVAGTGTNEDLSNPPTGPACLASDLFVDPANAIFRPRKGGARPCTLVDQGTNSNAPDHDLDGNPRPLPVGGNVDIGAYEAK